MMNNVVRKVVNGIGNGIVVLSIVILLLCLIALCLNIKPAVIVSGSMEPTIKTGSLVLINTNDKEAVERDIIAFRSGNIYVAHRVESVTDEGYITKGDANELADPGILKKEDLEGRIIMWVPHVGYVIKFMTSLPVIIICVMLVLVTLLLRVIRGKEETDDRKENSDGCCGTSS